MESGPVNRNRNLDNRPVLANRNRNRDFQYLETDTFVI